MAETDTETPAKKMEPGSVKCISPSQSDRTSLRQFVRCAGFATIAVGCLSSAAQAQISPMDRLSGAGLEVHSPDSRVSGPPGDMRIASATCPPRDAAGVRKRIVDIAIQEWAFFGFHVVDQTGPPPPRQQSSSFVRRPWLDPSESERVAASIAGYWSVTPDGSWILDRQNDFWSGPLGVAERWRDPWSAAFVSWTLCEAGFGQSDEFRRSINHRTYIDQAIHARDANSQKTAFVAYDVGEREITPGDLLCSARRHGYRNLDDRRRHLGEGARTHCDIVVHIDQEQDRILAIGGNVLGRVTLKQIYAISDSENGRLHKEVGRGSRAIFAHLRLSAATSADIGMLYSPSIRSLASDPAQRAALEGLLQMGLPVPDDS
jgi:hypothetical protein